MPAEKPHNSLFALQLGHIDIEVHRVDPLDRKLHVMTKDIGHALCLASSRIRAYGIASRRRLDRSSVLLELGSANARYQPAIEATFFNTPRRV
jgi:hypothetical protein